MKELSDLKNVGKATLEDLHLLSIDTVEELSKKNPTALFHELERRTHSRQDPCVWDVFASIIHEASGGEPTAWWKWTSKRKVLQKKGLLDHIYNSKSQKIKAAGANGVNLQAFFPLSIRRPIPACVGVTK